MPAPNGPKTGHKMKAYRNTGTFDTPVWSLVDSIGDLSIPDLTRGLAELKRRGNEYTKNLPTLIQSIALEFKLAHGLNMTLFGALVTAFFAGTAEEWAIMDNTITTEDAQGLRCPFLIEQFPWDQALEEVSAHDIRLAIAYMEESDGTEIDPSWMTVPAA
jgi:hypothetical protein